MVGLLHRMSFGVTPVALEDDPVAQHPCLAACPSASVASACPKVRDE